MREHPWAYLAAVELPGPGSPSVGAVQDHAIVADRPPLAGAGKVHRYQVGADRHLSLLPTPPGVVGIKNVPALANHHQTLTRTCQPGQWALDGQVAVQRGGVQRIRELPCHHLPGERQRHCQGQRSKHHPLVDIHRLHLKKYATGGTPHGDENHAQRCRTSGCPCRPGIQATIAPSTRAGCTSGRHGDRRCR
ncbi:hypothetical protein D3C76_1180150 [compost metagenome]